MVFIRYACSQAAREVITQIYWVVTVVCKWLSGLEAWSCMGKGDRWQVGKSDIVSSYIHATVNSSQYVQGVPLLFV